MGGMVSSSVDNIDISASTGVHDGAAVIKQLLAGAHAVQVCSSLYKNGIGELVQFKEDIVEWMEEKGFDAISDFRGKLSYKNIPDPQVYERSQFMKYFSSVE